MFIKINFVNVMRHRRRKNQQMTQVQMYIHN